MKNKNLDLNEIKTDLEIKLVKIELQKLKLKEKGISKVSKNKKVITKKKSPINKTKSKKVASKNNKKETTLKANNSKNKTIKKPITKEIATKKVTSIKVNSKKKPIKKPTTAKVVIAKKSIKPIVAKKVVTKKSTQTKTSVIAKKDSKKDSKKVIIAKRNSKTEKTKKSKNLLLLLLLPIFVLAFGYYFNNKNKLKIENQLLIEEKKEEIDYNENTYFKEVEDEIADEELQDFNIFKDVADPKTKDKSSVVGNTKSNNDVNFNPSNNNSQIIAVSSNNEVANRGNSTSKNLSEELLNELKLEEQLTTKENENTTSVNLQSTPKPEIGTDRESAKSNKKKRTKKENLKITSNIEDISAMKKVNGKLVAVNNVKKADSFKIKLNTKQNNTTDVHDNVEFMLVVKDQKGKTVKIDVKKVDFSKNKNAIITFSETLLNKISTKKKYTFYIYANKKMIEKVTKKFN